MADEEFFIDTHRLDQIAVALGNVPGATLPKVRSAVQFNATLVKQEWRKSLQGNRFAPRVPYAITYDTHELADAVTAEIGAEKGTGKQGGVALLLEYGAPAKKLAPRGYGMQAVQDNLDDLRHGITRAIADGAAAAGL
ncbi:hypothetical protein [Curtobacterium sp. MCBD17_030]|uniref:hypothetical protein n=1 Tax=Curtobacterium sp. MCBD17_030 TaxID=2175649 RepID=UPI000D82F90F|nr:hypothetical protein [Curtobacterium sp. MCBD17_030]PYY32357.1 hypothetical protein DEI89_13055 [Curtobacterium sp. MCBD17_030]